MPRALLLLFVSFPCFIFPAWTQTNLSALIERGKRLAIITQVDSARACFNQAMEAYEAEPADSLDLAGIYFGFAEVAYREGRYDDGLPHAREALEILKYCLGDEPTYEVVDSYAQIGRFYRRKGQFKKALTYYQKTLEIERARPEKNLDRVARSYSDMGNIYQSLGEYEKARNFMLESLDLDTLVHGSGHPEIAISLHNIGVINSKLGDYDEAIRYTLHGLEIRLKNYGEVHLDVGKSYFMLGDYHRIKGDMEQARMYNERAIEIWLETRGPDHPNTGAAYVLAGIICAEQGDYDCALSYSRRALTIQQKRLGENHPQVAGTLGNIGHIYQLKGDYAAALWHIQKALDMKIKRIGPTHPWVSESYRELGRVYHEEKAYDLAIEMYEHAVTIDEPRLVKGHAVLAENKRYLADVYRSKEDWQQATALYEAAIADYQGTFGDSHPFLGEIFLGLAEIQQKQANLEGALIYLNKGFRALQVSLPEAHPAMLPAIERVDGKLVLLDLLEMAGKTYYERYGRDRETDDIKSALGMFLRATDLIDSIRVGFQQEGAKRQLAEKALPAYEGAITTSYELSWLEPDPKWVSLAFSLSERSKATLLHESMQESHALQFGGLPDDLREQERALRLNLSFYKKSIYEEKILGENADTARIQKWEIRQFESQNAYDSLLSQLEQEFPLYHQLKYSLAVPEIATMQAELPAGNIALLEYFVGDADIYAFLIRKESAEVVRFDKDFPLDSLVSGMRKGIEAGFVAADQPETEGPEMAYEQIAAELYERLLAPLEKIQGGLPDRLIIVPDGVLGYLPFDALLTQIPEEIGKYKFYPYLIHDYQISYAYAARLWINSRQQITRPNKTWVAFSPAFERANMASAQSLLRNDFGYLAHSKPEVMGIRDLIGGDAFFDEQASEANFKLHAPNYRVVHISSHAKVNDDNPLYSRIAFTEGTDTTEDNFLEVAELFNMRLQADMVVLSACETGRGKLYRGEGIVSLARGFTYAGAKSILTTLWSVNDAATSDIMQRFYSLLDEGQTKDEALRESKLSYLASQDNLGAHPFYWSGYIMTGEMEPLDLSGEQVSWGKWLTLILLIGLMIIGGRRIVGRRVA